MVPEAQSSNRTPVRNPVGFDRPEFWGQYRDSRENVFLDGKSNLVLRITKDGDKFFGGLISGNWRSGIGTTWEARIKLNCLTGGAWPAWWLSNDFPGREGEVDLMEWYGNGEWPAGTTVHADPWVVLGAVTRRRAATPPKCWSTGCGSSDLRPTGFGQRR